MAVLLESTLTIRTEYTMCPTGSDDQPETERVAHASASEQSETATRQARLTFGTDPITEASASATRTPQRGIPNPWNPITDRRETESGPKVCLRKEVGPTQIAAMGVESGRTREGREGKRRAAGKHSGTSERRGPTTTAYGQRCMPKWRRRRATQWQSTAWRGDKAGRDTGLPLPKHRDRKAPEAKPDQRRENVERVISERVISVTTRGEARPAGLCYR